MVFVQDFILISFPKSKTGPMASTDPQVPFLDAGALMKDKGKLEDLNSIPLPALPTWADAFWRTMYFVARMYPDQPSIEEQRSMVNFMTSLQQLLPCTTCREHFAVHLSELDRAKLSRVTLYQWIFNVQNDINRRNGKHIYTWDQSVHAVKTMSLGKGAHSPSQCRPGTNPGANHVSKMPVWAIVLVVCLALAVGVAIGVITQKHPRKDKLKRD